MKQRILSALAVTSLLGCSVVGIRTTEEPDFTVLLEDGDVQVRSYGALLVARTVIHDEDFKDAGNRAFRRLADYIFGNNVQSEKIAMTAPVMQAPDSETIAMTAPVLQQRSERGWTMQFVLPREYTLDSAPRPVHGGVELAELPPRKVVAIRYSGRWTEKNRDKYTEQLRAWIEENGYEARSDFVSAGYDPPWTLPFLRRNEVMVEVSG